MIRHIAGSPSRADSLDGLRFISMLVAHEQHVLSLASAVEPGGLSTISNPQLSFPSRAHHIDIAQ